MINRDFIKLVLEQSGVYNSGNFKQEYRMFIEKFFDTGEFSNYVSLLEVPLVNIQSFDISKDKVDELIGYLMAYSLEICRSIDPSSQAFA